MAAFGDIPYNKQIIFSCYMYCHRGEWQISAIQSKVLTNSSILGTRSESFWKLSLWIYTSLKVCVRYHYTDVIMSAIAPQITSLTIVYSIVYSGADQRKHQSSSSLAFGRGIHRWPVNSLHKGPVTRKTFPFDDVIMFNSTEGYIDHRLNDGSDLSFKLKAVCNDSRSKFWDVLWTQK